MKKALWVVRDKITTPEAIDDLLEASAVRGIFDLVVQVRGRGDAYYASALEPRAETLATDFDPLDRLVRYGGSVGARIHAWANVFFVWSHPERQPPKEQTHVVNRHPDWLLRPDGVGTLDPAGGTDFEGIYTDPSNVAARAHTLAVFEDIVRRYRVDGLHYDYVRYPQITYASSPDDHAHVTALVRESARPGYGRGALVPDRVHERARRSRASQAFAHSTAGSWYNFGTSPGRLDTRPHNVASVAALIGLSSTGDVGPQTPHGSREE